MIGTDAQAGGAPDAWADAWIGTPYADIGRGPVAFDCWGLVWAVYRDVFGVTVPAYDEAYAASTDGAGIQAVIDRECRAWHRQRVAAMGDVIVFRILGRRMHCGVALGGERFLHILFGARCCVERMSDATWRHRVAGIYRHDALA